MRRHCCPPSEPVSSSGLYFSRSMPHDMPNISPTGRVTCVQRCESILSGPLLALLIVYLWQHVLADESIEIRDQERNKILREKRVCSVISNCEKVFLRFISSFSFSSFLYFFSLLITTSFIRNRYNIKRFVRRNLERYFKVLLGSQSYTGLRASFI